MRALDLTRLCVRVCRSRRGSPLGQRLAAEGRAKALAERREGQEGGITAGESGGGGARVATGATASVPAAVSSAGQSMESVEENVQAIDEERQEAADAYGVQPVEAFSVVPAPHAPHEAGPVGTEGAAESSAGTGTGTETRRGRGSDASNGARARSPWQHDGDDALTGRGDASLAGANGYAIAAKSVDISTPPVDGRHGVTASNASGVTARDAKAPAHPTVLATTQDEEDEKEEEAHDVVVLVDGDNSGNILWCPSSLLLSCTLALHLSALRTKAGVQASMMCAHRLLAQQSLRVPAEAKALCASATSPSAFAPDASI